MLLDAHEAELVAAATGDLLGRELVRSTWETGPSGRPCSLHRLGRVGVLRFEEGQTAGSAGP